jgi:hypothetical protein
LIEESDVSTPFNDQWRLPYWEDARRPYKIHYPTGAEHTAGSEQGPIKPLEPIDNTQPEIPKVGTTDAPGG